MPAAAAVAAVAAASPDLQIHRRSYTVGGLKITADEFAGNSEDAYEVVNMSHVSIALHGIALMPRPIRCLICHGGLVDVVGQERSRVCCCCGIASRMLKGQRLRRM